jgi:N-methylhydantoinase B
MRLDPISLEIIGTKVAAATEEMGYALQRSGRTLYVKETADFGTALADMRGKFFAYPRQIGVSGFIDLDCGPSIEAVGALEPGDVIVTNHPYASKGLSTHAPDIHLVKPYFHDGQIVCYGWTFVHSADVGGRVPSSISPSSHELFQEGFLMPPLKLLRGGRWNEEVVTLFRANVRTPDENMGDLKAMIAALLVGERRVQAILAQHGRAAFLDAEADLIAYSAEKARAAYRTIPDGTYEFWDYLDDELVSPIPTRLRVAVTASDGLMTLDFTGTDPQIAAAFNVPTMGRRHSWLSLRLAGFALTRDPSIPLNSGIFDPITIKVPEGTLLNPVFPAAVGVRHATTGRTLDVINGALAQALPDFMPACSGGVIIPVVLAEGEDTEGRRNVIVVEPMVGGMGARRGADGVDGRDSSTANLGNNPIETVEAGAGILIEDYALRTDSGGPGKWRGGVGLGITFSVAREGAQVLGRGMERFRFAPWGLCGGRAGQPARTVLNIGWPNERELGKIDVVELEPGNTITIMTPGGGGYGDPFERDPAVVHRDVERGLVSVAAAETDYGVVLLDGRVDRETTAAKRAARSARRGDPFDLGPARAAWEVAFDDALMGRINRAILALPLGARRSARRRIFAPVLDALDPAAPLDPARLLQGRVGVEAVLRDYERDRAA